MILYLGKSKQKLCFDVLLQKTSKFFFYIGALSIGSETAHALVNAGFRTFIWISKKKKKIGHKKEKKHKPGIEFIHYWELLYVSGKLPTYSSPKPTLTFNALLGQNIGLGEG